MWLTWIAVSLCASSWERFPKRSSNLQAVQRSLPTRFSRSFLQKLALLKKVGVAFSNHLLLGEFRDKQPARIRFRPAVFHEADVVTSDNPVGRFDTLPHAMNLFHAE